MFKVRNWSDTGGRRTQENIFSKSKHGFSFCAHPFPICPSTCQETSDKFERNTQLNSTGLSILVACAFDNLSSGLVAAARRHLDRAVREGPAHCGLQVPQRRRRASAIRVLASHSLLLWPYCLHISHLWLRGAVRHFPGRGHDALYHFGTS